MIQHLNDKDKRAFGLIRNKIAHFGESPTLREINEVTGGKSPRSASLVIDRLIKAGLIKKIGRQLILIGVPSSVSVTTVDVPLVGAVTCGTPILAEQNIQTRIPVSTALAKKGSIYFFLRAIGDSMDQAGIKSGDLLLVRQQAVAENGDRVVALINDEATVKIFEQVDEIVILRPKSSNKKHKPIILTDNCIIQGVVVTVLPENLY
jgi:repressor LexA